MSTKNVDTFNASHNRLRAADFQDAEERENAAYAERHNLQILFSEFGAHLREKDPKTEHEAERILLDLLTHRKAERDRAALRLRFKNSFEVSLENGRRMLKMTVEQDTAFLQVTQKTRNINLDGKNPITIEQSEELTELFYELGRFVLETQKGEVSGFISIDDRDVYLLSGGKDCLNAGDELFNVALLMNMNASKVEKEKQESQHD
ncbi:unnamed protein product [Phytomonas sp. Hart1]|nr:unnamed protein product [Phytomonas sp. Hart1]|eukprot:CCW67050.1 unnamed protein product [Phytomonas sp. isolate Hart1]